MPSPSLYKPVARTTLTFGEAIAELLDGKRLTMLAWNTPTAYIFLLDGILSLRKADGSVHHLIVSDGDLLGTWMEVPAQPGEVLTMVKNRGGEAT